MKDGATLAKIKTLSSLAAPVKACGLLQAKGNTVWGRGHEMDLSLMLSFNIVVANSFSCAQTKTILGGTFAPYFLASLVAGMKNGFFSVAAAGLNDPHTKPVDSRHSPCGLQGSHD